MLKELTRVYIAAFNEKNLERCAALMADDFALEDPVVKRVQGKPAVLKIIKDLFSASDTFSFVARNIFQDGDTTLIEFVLTIGDKVLTGVDVIAWQDGVMSEMRAYLDV